MTTPFRRLLNYLSWWNRLAWVEVVEVSEVDMVEVVVTVEVGMEEGVMVEEEVEVAKDLVLTWVVIVIGDLVVNSHMGEEWILLPQINSLLLLHLAHMDRGQGEVLVVVEEEDNKDSRVSSFQDSATPVKKMTSLISSRIRDSDQHV